MNPLLLNDNDILALKEAHQVMCHQSSYNPFYGHPRSEFGPITDSIVGSIFPSKYILRKCLVGSPRKTGIALLR